MSYLGRLPEKIPMEHVKHSPDGSHYDGEYSSSGAGLKLRGINRGA